MPELPEVETVVRQLEQDLKGLIIEAVKVFDDKLNKRNISWAKDCKITSLDRVGKFIVLNISKSAEERHLVCHLRMSGRLIWNKKGNDSFDIDSITKKSLTHRQRGYLRVIFYTNKGHLLFIDTRRFGTLEVRRDLKGLIKGVEPLSSEFSKAKLKELIQNKKVAIKKFLLDQQRIVGIGNIYASEILFRSRVHPNRITSELTDEEVALIVKNTKSVLKKAIKNCGTTFSDFQDSRGEIGNYQNYLTVYGKDKEPCSVCNGEIQKMQQGGRSTFYCGVCQI
jgi:formamidopyrimidine-DNA glycosylase